MPGKISILKESGETLSTNIVSIFMIPDTQKRYLISTENTVDPHGLTVLHVSEIVDGTLQKIATDEEWSSIKTIMRAIISGNVGSYQYLQSMDSIKANAQYSRDISVSASAAKQMIDNYATREVNDVAVENKEDNTIFPSEGTNEVDSSDEVAPGIAVVNTPPVETQVISAPEIEETVVDPTPVTVAEEPVVVVPTNPEPIPVSAPVSTPITEVVPVAEPTPVVVENHKVTASPVTLPVSEPVVVSGPEPVAFVPQADLYVAPVAPVVPTAQIVQEAQPAVTGIKFDTNVTPSFAPNASLDELVLASQEMFLEGVKNLVQTIQEKIYREMFNKEAELKAKEEMLNQREKMLNEQMMSMMSNFAAMQGGTVQVQPTETVGSETENV